MYDRKMEINMILRNVVILDHDVLVKIAKEAGKDNGKNKYREMERKLSG